jgi:hypothetical protein
MIKHSSPYIKISHLNSMVWCSYLILLIRMFKNFSASKINWITQNISSGSKLLTTKIITINIDQNNKYINDLINANRNSINKWFILIALRKLQNNIYLKFSFKFLRNYKKDKKDYIRKIKLINKIIKLFCSCFKIIDFSILRVFNNLIT